VINGDRNLRVLRPVWATTAAFAGAAVLYFDLGPPTPFVDDAVYAWYVRSLAAGRGLVSYPDFVPLALTHRLIGVVGTLGHTDLRLLRLTVFAFLVLTAWATYASGRRLGASAGWAAAGALSLAANPIMLSVATSFMTDVVFVGLLMTAVYAGIAWIRDGGSRPLMVAATLLSVGERQVGISAAIAVTAALWIRARRGRGLTGPDQAWLAVLWAGIVALSVLSLRLGARPTASVGSGALTSIAVEGRQLLDWIAFAPGMCGFVFLPFLPAVVLRTRARADGAITPALAGAALVVCIAVVAMIVAGGVLPSGHLNAYGLGPAAVSRYGFGNLRLGHPAGALDKPIVFPWTFLGAIAVASIATSCLAVYCAVRNRTWISTLLEPVTVFLFLCAVVQVPLLALVSHYDRYYLSALAPLMPIAAQRASAWRPHAGSITAVPFVVLGLLVYVVGQQDYEAWQSARDSVARRLYQTVSPENVDAGWETNFQYAWLPAYDQGRQVMGPIRFHLEFARRGDPRPGQDYQSMAPGRIVIAPGEAPTSP
jgi:hypothetical protein